MSARSLGKPTTGNPVFMTENVYDAGNGRKVGANA